MAEKRGALFIFLGEPIGLDRDELQASNRHRTVSQIKVCEGLALKIIFGPDSIERLSQDCHIKPECADQLNWPTLREGSVYRVGCRITYLNGAGPGRDYMEVREAYQQGAPTLGTSASQAFPFEAAQIEPPRVCLHQFDKVVQRDRKKFPGSNAHTVVLAHDDKQYRVVLPPSIAWDSAEQQGQFDGVNNPATGNLSLARRPAHGLTNANRLVRWPISRRTREAGECISSTGMLRVSRFP